MSTRSNIAILNNDGTVTAIYCHWDGGLEHNGMILSKYYSSPEKVIELISGGDLSFLVTNINARKEQNPKNPNLKINLSENAELRTYPGILELCKSIEKSNIEYLYLYIGGDWWYWDICRAERFTLKHLKTDLTT